MRLCLPRNIAIAVCISQEEHKYFDLFEIISDLFLGTNNIMQSC